MTLVGTDVTMVGGLAKVTGAVDYAADLVFPRMLHAKALRSPYPHAKLLRLDARKAEKFAGVVAVVTRDAAWVPIGRRGMRLDMAVLHWR